MLYENTGNVDRFCNYASGNVWTEEDLRNPFAVQHSTSWSDL